MCKTFNGGFTHPNNGGSSYGLKRGFWRGLIRHATVGLAALALAQAASAQTPRSAVPNDASRSIETEEVVIPDGLDDGPTAGPVVANVRRGSYPINATGIDGLRRAITESLRPIGGGRSGVASTKVTMTPRVEYRESDGRCSIRSARVELDTLVTLPEWRQLQYGNATERAWWNGYTGELLAHENLHVGIAEEWATRLQSIVAGLGPAPSCEALRAQVADAERRVLERHNAAQIALDVRTRQEAARR